MKPLIADVHTHTLASGHAYGTIREMAQAASERQLQLLGISEHAPGIPGTVNPFYFFNLNVVPRILYGVHIIHGCEVNVYSDGTLSLGEEYLEHLDYAIAGIHTLCYEDQGRTKNTQNLIRCIQNPKIRFVSHPDDDHTPLDYEELVKAAKEFHIALEVNNSSLIKKDHRWNCIENYKTMLAFCEQYEVPVILNSDAHDPSSVGDFELAVRLLEEVHFREELVLNTDFEKVLNFLTK